MDLRRTLGIETSCDETAVAVIDAEGRVESNVLSSQVSAHAPYGGVVPELAAREHLKALPVLTRQALEGARGPIELVAATRGPGLIGALLVGVRFAAAFSWSRGLPLVGVDHLEGHLVSPFLTLDDTPAKTTPSDVLALVASGGHSSWFRVTQGKAERLCRTRDDAAGESFDKVGQVLALSYPGGPEIDRLARDGDSSAVPLPRPRLKDGSIDFSFSGLKSAAIRWIHANGLEGQGVDPSKVVRDLLASYERAVVDQLLGPLPGLVESYRPQLVTASGGVASNTLLRARLEEACREMDIEVLLPSPHLTTDNGAMIARAGQLAFARGSSEDPRRIDARARVAWQPPGMRKVS